jgi:hypothetical protein
MKKRFTVAALFAATILAAQSPAAVNFTGDWKLNLSKSDYGPIQQFAPEFMIRSIRHNDPALQISTHSKGARGETTTDLKYTTDGKPMENKGSKGSAKWDGDKLVVDSTQAAQGTELKQHDVWSLSPDGKVLTVNTHLSAAQGEFDILFVFDKQ